jgi:CheY-like chemotaxis protein
MSKSILIVDDNQAVRTITRQFLECQTDVGVCVEAVDGADAVEKARSLSPDLIILDLAMPRMNGFEARAPTSAVAAVERAHVRRLLPQSYLSELS